MKVKARDEAKVLLAASLLNDNLAHYKNHFGILDKQDLFAMVAFDAFFEKLSHEEKANQLVESISAEVDALTRQLDT